MPYRSCAVILFTLCVLTTTVAAAVDVGGRAPEIGLPDLAGNRVTLAGLRGRVFLVDLWATYCLACAEELPMLQSLYDELHANGFTVIAVTSERDRATVEAFVQRRHLSFPIVHDPAQVIPPRYDSHAQPQSFIVDRGGIVRHVHVGYRAGDADSIRREVRSLVAAPH